MNHRPPRVPGYWPWVLLVAACGIPQLGEVIGDGPPTVRRGGELDDERCLDGVDNDRDGQVDEDCGQAAPADANQERCQDGVDNDLDGQVDEDCPEAPGGVALDGPGAAGGEGGDDPDELDEEGEGTPAPDGGERGEEGDEGGEAGQGPEGEAEESDTPDEPEGPAAPGDGGGGDGAEEEQGCDNGWADCDGECMNLRTDPFNCGVCGNACVGSQEECAGGDCQEDDGFEDNDDSNAAVWVDPPVTYGDLKAFPNDADWFRVPGCRGGRIFVVTEFVPEGEGQSLHLGILTADGDVLRETGPIESGDPQDLDMAGAMPHFVEILSEDGDGGVYTYALNISTDCQAQADDDGDEDGFGTELDCNDADPAVHPAANEICDGQDNDCDGVVDEDVDAQCDDEDDFTVDTCEGEQGCLNRRIDDCN